VAECVRAGPASFELKLNIIVIFLKNAASHKVAIYRLSITKIRLRFGKFVKDANLQHYRVRKVAWFFVSCVMMDLAAAETPAVEFSEVCEPFIVPLARSLIPAGPIPGQERFLDRGEHLYREGSSKAALYRLESGILCLTSRRADGPPNVVEMIFPGTLLGLGFLEHHIDSAMAVVPCRLIEYPLDAAAALCRASPEASERQAVLTEREFAARRRELVPAKPHHPVQRVAAFLTAMYHMNRHEGRNPADIAEFLKTGDVAAFLDLKIEDLADALAELKARGVVDRADHGGLVILQPGELERLSDAA
jgi:CRP/FNR family transcriptional regulator